MKDLKTLGAAFLALSLLNSISFASGNNSPDNVYLLDASGNVLKNGKKDSDRSTSTSMECVGMTCSSKLSAFPILASNGDTFDGDSKIGYYPPVDVHAVSIYAVGMEVYVLTLEGDVWRYFRKGPGKGEVKKEAKTSLKAKDSCVDIAIQGPLEDRVDRDVYILSATGTVYLNGEKQAKFGPSVDISAKAIEVDQGDVYVMDGSNGDVYKNGKKLKGKGPSTAIACVDMKVWEGSIYVLSKNGDVYINGKKKEEVSAKSAPKKGFVALVLK